MKKKFYVICLLAGVRISFVFIDSVYQCISSVDEIVNISTLIYLLSSYYLALLHYPWACTIKLFSPCAEWRMDTNP
jgi:hypothetical protein